MQHEMASSEVEQTESSLSVEERLEKLEKGVAQKDGYGQFQVNWTEWKAGFTGDVGKYVEIIAIAKLTSLVKFGLPTLLDLGKPLENYIENHFKRNKFGWLFGKKPEDETARKFEEHKNWLQRHDGQIDGQRQRFDQRFGNVETGLRNTNRRVNSLETGLSSIRSRQSQVRGRVNSVPRQDPTLTSQQTRIRDLEVRINGLVAALG
ncbi:hypothetical protein ACFU99_23395 [Streptomyces sp. NPDC057654]|uniref:hypothetical protein n=1 Tax=Streptomyces sp. NPDC057654 TaxID=3346196 RepID=UPI0036A89FFC